MYIEIRADRNILKPKFLFECVAERLDRQLEEGTLAVDVYRRAQARISQYLAELENENDFWD